MEVFQPYTKVEIFWPPSASFPYLRPVSKRDTSLPGTTCHPNLFSYVDHHESQKQDLRGGGKEGKCWNIQHQHIGKKFSNWVGKELPSPGSTFSSACLSAFPVHGSPKHCPMYQRTLQEWIWDCPGRLMQMSVLAHDVWKSYHLHLGNSTRKIFLNKATGVIGVFFR